MVWLPDALLTELVSVLCHVLGWPVAGLILTLTQSDDGRDLNRLEDSVIEIALDSGERGDQLTISEAEPNAPSGHVETL